MLFNNGSFVSSVSSSVEILYSDNALSSPSIYGIIPPPKTSRVTWQANMDLDDECQVIHEVWKDGLSLDFDSIANSQVLQFY